MEEWLQTEWPDLRVHCTSVTEQWATVALVGPRSRDVARARSRPTWTCPTTAFPFMTVRETERRRHPGAGLPDQLLRRAGLRDQRAAPGTASRCGRRCTRPAQPYGITPYGTETMHVLRAEKGYPIIGQDTDGTVTPQDLGMGWAVSKKKRLRRQAVVRRAPTPPAPTASSWSACCPDDPAPSSAGGRPAGRRRPYRPVPPVPMLGHVTSSYRSAALGRTFALGLLRRRADRIGRDPVRRVATGPAHPGRRDRAGVLRQGGRAP